MYEHLVWKSCEDIWYRGIMYGNLLLKSCVTMLCGNHVWKYCVEILCGSVVWKSCMEVMSGNYASKPVGKKYVWIFCTEIVFEFVEHRGTDFQEVGGTGRRKHGGTGGSGFIYQGIKYSVRTL